MKCLDCAFDDHVDRDAVGTCIDCGAGLCGSHVVVVRRHQVRLLPMVGRELTGAAGRELRCFRCHGAQPAVSEG